MITVRVKNFQSIKDAFIEVDGFTVITGPNNSGKSSLMRAIRGVFQNTPGTTFVRHGTEVATVEVDLGDYKVRWSKGTGKKTRPTYVLDDGHPIHPGQAIPDEVRALGIQSIEAGGRDVWPQFAPQFTGQVFLLDQPGSVLAEAVADVERVGQLNRALKAVQSDGRMAASTLKIRRGDQVRLQGDLEKFEGLDEVLTQTESIEVDIQQAAKIRRVMGGLTDIQERLVGVTQTVEILEGVEQIVVPDDTLTPLLDDLGDLQGLQDRSRVAQRQVEAFEGIEQVHVTLDSNPSEKISDALDLLVGLRGQLQVSTARIRTFQAELEDNESEVQGIGDELMGRLAEIGNCPMCGQIISSGDLHDC